MERIIILLTFCFFLACSGEKIDTITYPEDLAGKKKLLIKKKGELKELKALIGQLTNEISELDTTKREKPKALVTTQMLERKDFKRYINIQAAVMSDDVLNASSETGGRILQQDFKEGDYLKKGQLIARIDLEAVNKQIAELNTSISLAKDVYQRQSRLWKQKIGTEMQYLESKNTVERLEKTLESLQHQLTKANVYAPTSGYVDRVFAKTGEMAGPGAPILQIMNTSRVKVVADVPEIYLSVIKRGEMVDINFPAIDYQTKGRVNLIGRSINPANRTFKVEVGMNNSKGLLKPNLLADMKINDYTLKDAVTVPLDLVQQEVSGANYVYIKADSPEGPMAKKIYVETGESTEGRVIVNTGLKGNEEIVVDGARSLTENELLKIEPVVEKTDVNI